jgi:hypothetical protein
MEPRPDLYNKQGGFCEPRGMHHDTSNGSDSDSADEYDDQKEWHRRFRMP